jgi:hypothetical protein
VLQFVLKHFTELERHGILIRVNSESVAFSIFEFLNPTNCVFHFEKAIIITKAYTSSLTGKQPN